MVVVSDTVFFQNAIGAKKLFPKVTTSFAINCISRNLNEYLTIEGYFLSLWLKEIYGPSICGSGVDKW